jgi:hypothetical protein
MQKKVMKETWEEQKEDLKQKFVALTETNVLFVEDKEKEMMTKL